MSKDEIAQYLNELSKIILQTNNWQKISFTKEWLSGIPEEAGVYVFKDKTGPVYVGKTGNIRGRMRDLFDTRNHTIRHSIGEKFFSSDVNYSPASSKTKFHPIIEQLVSDHICNSLHLSFLEVSLGRKELEIVIEKTISKEHKLNIRSERKRKIKAI